MALALCGLILGSFPSFLQPLLQGLVSGLSGNAAYQLQLSLFHGVTVELALSLATILVAALLVWVKLNAYAFQSRPARSSLPTESVVNAVLDIAQFQFRFIQSGYLRRYFLWVLITTMAFVTWIFIRSEGLLPTVTLGDVSPYGVTLSVVLIAASICACRSRTILLSVACLGIIGAVIALFFLLFGAPDLAITQFVVEALTVILLVLLLNKLPDFTERSSKWAEYRDITVSILFGTMMGLFVLWSGEIQIGPSLAAWFVESSIPLGFGRNVTNVIIVDFRALDTLGEITVLAVAGIGVFALLDPRSRTKERL
jgi:multicomponent Na+:H+ antiporter subunit A